MCMQASDHGTNPHDHLTSLLSIFFFVAFIVYVYVVDCLQVGMVLS